MREKALLLLVLLSIATTRSNQAQTQLWGMTSLGGDYSVGTLFNTDGDGNNHRLEHSLFMYEGGNPQHTEMCEASNGLLYGMTTMGGSNGSGVIFSYNPATSTYTKLIDFGEGDNGSIPCGSLMEANNGLLYGMTSVGGTNGSGVIFSYNPATSTYIKLHDFHYTNGAEPYGSLIQADNGLLYGMTSGGGTNYKGVMFSFDPTVSAYSKLLDFNGTANGSIPRGSLMQASNGLLYGMTTQGGTSDYGVIFSYDPATLTYTKLIDFNGTNGHIPHGNLIQANDGLLYGMTFGGGNGIGVIFFFNIATSNITKVHDFDWISGSLPMGSLMQAGNGLLYGMTHQGGTDGSGVMFSFNPATSTYTKMLDFNGEANGSSPFGSLMQATNGLLYGMTHYGGTKNKGVIFSFNLDSSTCTRLLEFNFPDNGGNPRGSLIKASNGLLYGVTESGGTNDMGVIFSYNPTTSSYTKLFDFDGAANGCNPYGSLMQASNGLLYGTTRFGGTNNMGVIFSFNPATHTYSKLIDFNGLANGSKPHGSLIEAKNGLLYGMTFQGGTNNHGIMFSYNPATFSYTKLHDFELAVEGCHPLGSLIQANNDLLYGMTAYGGTNNWGVIFSYNPYNSSYTKLVEFNGSNGRHPFGSLMQATNGLLYGMTNEGGNYDLGVIFSYNPNISDYTKLFDFDWINGYRPHGNNLIQANNGLLYGMTRYGGINEYGVIFEYNYNTSTFSKKLDFKGSNGREPCGDLVEVCFSYTLNSANESACDSYTWSVNGQTYNVSGTYTVITGCHIEELVLTINSVDTSVTFSGGSLTANASGATYKWLDCGNNYAVIAEATNQTYTPATAGNYAVEVTQNNCTDTSSCYNVTSTGILTSSEDEEIVVYPNPFSYQAILQTRQVLNNATLIIYDVLGHVVEEVKNINGQKIILQRNHLQTGLYFIYLTDNIKQIATKKIIITDKYE